MLRKARQLPSISEPFACSFAYTAPLTANQRLPTGGGGLSAAVLGATGSLLPTASASVLDEDLMPYRHAPATFCHARNCLHRPIGRVEAGLDGMLWCCASTSNSGKQAVFMMDRLTPHAGASTRPNQRCLPRSVHRNPQTGPPAPCHIRRTAPARSRVAAATAWPPSPSRRATLRRLSRPPSPPGERLGILSACSSSRSYQVLQEYV